MSIFTQIKNSIYNKEYYKSVVLTESIRDSVRYLAKLTLWLALLASVMFAFSIPISHEEAKRKRGNKDYALKLIGYLRNNI